jgi:hypothetical protein
MTSRNPGQTPSLNGTPQGVSLLREVVDRKCVAGIWRASARATEVDFPSVLLQPSGAASAFVPEPLTGGDSGAASAGSTKPSSSTRLSTAYWIEHVRYINFISDFMAANKKGSHEEVVKAWEELKAMDAPKTYESWAKARKRHKGRV